MRRELPRGATLPWRSRMSRSRSTFEAIRRTERTTSLVGLMRAAEKMGDRKKADEIRAKLKTIWRHADHPIATEVTAIR